MTYRAPYPDQTINGYTFSADKKKLDLQYVYNLLCLPSQYSMGVPAERFPLLIEHSICFGVYFEAKQIGFARVITDRTEFASLWDVIIDEAHRKKGLGKTLMTYVLAHTELQGIFRWFLMTEDAHGLYQRYGFKSEAYNPYIMMKTNSS